MKSILLVEYDRILAETYSILLAKFFQIDIAKTAQEAVDILDSKKINLIITDTILGRHNGIEILHEVRSHQDWLDVKFLILSSLPQIDFPIVETDWANYGIEQFLYKPKTRPATLLFEANKALL